MRQPRWTSGAYAEEPHFITTTSTGESVAFGAIECWRGTPEELLEPARAAIAATAADGSQTMVADVVWSDGSRDSFDCLDDLAGRLVSGKLDDVLAIRIASKSQDERIRATLTARVKLPGYSIEVVGTDPSRVMGATTIAFRRIMIGYVDRAGGWRGLTWILASIAPMLLLSIVFSSDRASALLRLTVASIGIVTSAAAFLLSYPLLVDSRPLVLTRVSPGRARKRSRVWLGRVTRHRYTRQALTILLALVVGIVGNKISDRI